MDQQTCTGSWVTRETRPPRGPCTTPGPYIEEEGFSRPGEVESIACWLVTIRMRRQSTVCVVILSHRDRTVTDRPIDRRWRRLMEVHTVMSIRSAYPVYPTASQPKPTGILGGGLGSVGGNCFIRLFTLKHTYNRERSPTQVSLSARARSLSLSFSLA